MGGDGGVIAVKRGFVRGTKAHTRAEEAVKDAESAKRQGVNRSKHCAISNEKLVEPIVACELGSLYKKEALLTALLEKALNIKFAHIRGLKDVKVLKFAPNPDYQEGQDVEGALVPQFRCPITQMEFNGIQPFVFIWSTGWVLSEKAVREIGVEGLNAEYGPFSESDIIRLIPSEEETEVLRAKMEEKRKVKKDKKRSRDAAAMEGTHKPAGPGNLVPGDDTSSSVTKKVAKVAPSATGSRPVDVSLTKGAITAASTSISKKEVESEVFKKLFHSDKEAKSNGRDLMMSTAGFRYGLA